MFHIGILVSPLCECGYDKPNVLSERIVTHMCHLYMFLVFCRIVKSLHQTSDYFVSMNKENDINFTFGRCLADRSTHKRV